VCLGFLGDSAVSVWKMDKIPGVGFLMMLHDDNIRTKLLTTVVDMAKLALSKRAVKHRVLD
jgi:hypothetical protein